MDSHTWSERFDHEILTAQQARARGNEGMARVCARRAAGLLAQEYLRRAGIPPRGPSAYDHLRLLQTLPDLPAPWRSLLEHFTLRITPEHQLPVQADLIAEALELRRALIAQDA